MCQPCFLVCLKCRGVSTLYSSVSRVFSGVSKIVAVYPPCFLVCLECRGVPTLFSSLSKVFFCVFALSSGVSRMSRCVRLVFLRVHSVFWCVQSVVV